MHISLFPDLSLFGSISPSESWSAGHSLQDLCSCSQVRSSQLKSPHSVLTLFLMSDLQAKYVCFLMFWLFFFSQYSMKNTVQPIAQHLQLLSTIALVCCCFFRPFDFRFPCQVFSWKINDGLNSKLTVFLFKLYVICPALLFRSRCPFLLNLDLIGIANHFAQLNLPAFALGTLLLIPSAPKKEQQIQVSVSHVNATCEGNKKKSLFRSTSFPSVNVAPYIAHLILLELFFSPAPATSSASFNSTPVLTTRLFFLQLIFCHQNLHRCVTFGC